MNHTMSTLRCPTFVVILAITTNAMALPLNLREAGDYSRNKRGLSLLVRQGDKVIFEEYDNGNSSATRRKIYSGTKSFWALAAMVAVEDGLLRLDEPVAETITEWQDDPHKKQITLRQLLNFTDGIEPAFNLHGDAIKDRNGFAIALPIVRPPGTVFTYGPSHLQIFGEVLRRKLTASHQTPIAYLQKRVLTPLGIHALDFKKDGRGNPLLASGFRLTAREWARLGTVLLHKGSYDGRKIVDASLLEQCFHGSPVNPAFGIGLWNNRQASDRKAREPDIEDLLELKWYQQAWDHVCICREAPADMVVSLGSGYQRLYVIPSLDLLVVRQGLDAKFSDSEFLRILLGREIIH